MAAVALPFFLASNASAFCLGGSGNERLENFCLINEINGTRVDAGTVRLVDVRLKREGYRRGLGFPIAVPRHSIGHFATPSLRYSENVNGGDPPGPLILGNLRFDTDESRYRKKGLLAGVDAGWSGRHIYGEGRYFNHRVNGSYAHSTEHDVGVATIGANVCSINHISNWWYIDACADRSREHKDLGADDTGNVSVVGSRIFSIGSTRYAQAKLGVNRHFSNNSPQNQMVAGWETIHSNEMFTGLDLTFGESVLNQLATRFSASAKFIHQVAGKPLEVRLSFVDARGGLLFGIRRDERTHSASVGYPIMRGLHMAVGYRKTNSTIDYFDTSTPTFGVVLVASELSRN